MSDAEVYLAALRLVADSYQCHCDDAYTERLMHAPGCEHPTALEVVDDLAKAGLLRTDSTIRGGARKART